MSSYVYTLKKRPVEVKNVTETFVFTDRNIFKDTGNKFPVPTIVKSIRVEIFSTSIHVSGRDTYILRFAVCSRFTTHSDISLAWGEILRYYAHSQRWVFEIREVIFLAYP
jgi:hypothetical protein